MRQADTEERGRAGRSLGLLIVAWAIVLWTPTIVSGQEPEIEGSWQTSIDCGFAPYEYATASTFLRFEVAPGGTGLVAEQHRCPTLAVPGSIREIDCQVGGLGTAGFDGVSFWSPLDGPAFSIARPDPPLPFDLLGCPLVAEIENTTRQVGQPIRDDSGAVVAIRGETTAGPVVMRDPAGQICFELPTTYACTFEMRRADTRPGVDVTVEPRAGARLTFAEVLTPGHAAVVPLTALDAVLPPGFQLVGDTIQIVFDVTTTSDFRAPVTLCVAYEDFDDDGFVDGTNPPVPEEKVRMLHEENGIFVDRTSTLDVARNEVCGETDGLSRFALGDAVEAAVEPPSTRRLIPWLDGPTTASRIRRSFGGRSRLATR